MKEVRGQRMSWNEKKPTAIIEILLRTTRKQRSLDGKMVGGDEVECGELYKNFNRDKTTDF